MPQFVIDSTGILQQFTVCPFLHHYSVIDHENAVHILHGAQSVSNGY